MERIKVDENEKVIIKLLDKIDERDKTISELADKVDALTKRTDQTKGADYKETPALTSRSTKEEDEEEEEEELDGAEAVVAMRAQGKW